MVRYRSLYCVGARLPWGADFAFKVGIANNPDRRLSQMQTGNPLDLRIVALLGPSDDPRGVRLAERSVHSNLADHRIRSSEWFKADAPLVRWFTREFVRLQDDGSSDPMKWIRAFDDILGRSVEIDGRMTSGRDW